MMSRRPLLLAIALALTSGKCPGNQLYQVIQRTAGVCGRSVITTAAECDVAAVAFKLLPPGTSCFSVEDDFAPGGCHVRDFDRTVVFNNASTTAPCSSRSPCLCKACSAPVPSIRLGRRLRNKKKTSKGDELIAYAFWGLVALNLVLCYWRRRAIQRRCCPIEDDQLDVREVQEHWEPGLQAGMDRSDSLSEAGMSRADNPFGSSSGSTGSTLSAQLAKSAASV